MKRCIYIIAALFCLQQSLAQKVTFMPQWMAQPQFAGYYVAYEKGYYTDEGLDVTFSHMSRNATRTQVEELISGDVHIISMSLIQATQKRAEGIPMVNVLQVSQNNPNCCITQKPVEKLSDLNGLKIGRWKRGDIQLFSLIEKKYNLDIEWIPCIDGSELYLFDAVDATLACTYNELHKIEASSGILDPRCIIKASDYGYNLPADGLYVTEKYYKENKETIARFIRASEKGWEYARNHPQEALKDCNVWMQKTKNTSSSYHNRMMLEEILRLMVNPKTGKMDFAPIDSTDFNNLINEIYDLKYIERKVGYKDFIKSEFY